MMMIDLMSLQSHDSLLKIPDYQVLGDYVDAMIPVEDKVFFDTLKQKVENLLGIYR